MCIYMPVVMLAASGAFLEAIFARLILYREKCSPIQFRAIPRYVRHFESVDERYRWRDRGNVLLRNNEGDLRRYRGKVLQQRDGSIDTASGKV